MGDVSKIEIVAVPGLDVDIIEGEISAWVSLITSDNSWRKDTAFDLNVLKGDISHGDSWLGGAWSSKWVDHASWASTSWLFLLLWTDVDSPPNWVRNGEVFVFNISDDSISFISWVGLHINGFEWMFHDNIFEVNRLDAGVICAWGYRADGHTHREVDHRVEDCDILCAGGELICFVGRFDSNSIIIVGNGDISDEDAHS